VNARFEPGLVYKIFRKIRILARPAKESTLQFAGSGGNFLAKCKMAGREEIGND
jgi:hypothetical protein